MPFPPGGGGVPPSPAPGLALMIATLPIPSATPSPPPLTGLPRERLDALLREWGEKPYRTRQLWHWLYVRQAAEPALMSDLSKEFRTRLAAAWPRLRPAVRIQQERLSADGTRKWLLALEDGQMIETVFIPEEGRGTLCISSQVGCTLACPFCHTGMQGFARNLRADEIVEQVLLARQALEGGEERVTNVVLMGMGEPLYNYDPVVAAVRIIMDEVGIAIGTRKVTVSTAGVVPRIREVGRDLGCNLAISLHAVRDEVRDLLVPLNRKYDLAALRRAVLEYPFKRGRRIFWEYVLLDGINDSVADARLLVEYLREIPSKVNLIPFNPWEGAPYAPSSPERTARFQEVLWKAHLVAVVRESRGNDIAAACGQLKGELSGVRGRHPPALPA